MIEGNNREKDFNRKLLKPKRLTVFANTGYGLRGSVLIDETVFNHCTGERAKNAEKELRKTYLSPHITLLFRGTFKSIPNITISLKTLNSEGFLQGNALAAMNAHEPRIIRL